ncbi:MAG: flagellar basal-body rod protein FlgF [Tardiphaga sp.]|jgi:flagellar basal-body rod protein FlgF|uniref:flagellar basal-body rod protein FlgF n=1 Tax=Tardiphaga sp. TaxID=1926292 RepID=UPI00260418D2|nr:flagellar basal-body rod protein FlgF [Tardiphaga sp.]MDB5502050.1 flagellar basal-body rod protein FlgF [Tardiphaga sp.]
MENVGLIGLSRQMTLERQLDVVANNIANINTTGFKADRSVFEEYLRTPAHEDNFVGSDRRVSFVQDRATLHDLSSGPNEQTKNPLDVAIDGNAFLVVQTPGGERYTRDGGLQINDKGQLVTKSGSPVLGTSGPIVFQPSDKDINIAPDGNITVLEGVNRIDSVRGKLRLVSFSQAQRLLKEGSNLYAAGEGNAPQPSTTAKVNQGFIERSNVSSVMEMTRMMDVTRAYTQISAMLQQQADMRRSAIEKLADVPA